METRIQQSVKPAFPRMDVFSCPPMGLHRATTAVILLMICASASGCLGGDGVSEAEPNCADVDCEIGDGTGNTTTEGNLSQEGNETTDGNETNEGNNGTTD
ncbi:MAG: hypothetical protein QF612_07185, partial [Candidatus Thalassarchaeaceae archaeon]|nr:hypothetical protein [Candidatus Thalassarchaeaceae archaeon]